MKKIILMIFCMLAWSDVGLAICTTSIIASTPTRDFTINGNGTVTHSKTGLTWKRCSEGEAWNGTTCTGLAATYTWSFALQQAKALNNGGGYAGFRDWRVPNIKELNSIIEDQCLPAINFTIFPATNNTWNWSASPYAGNGTYAWLVVFRNGRSGATMKIDSGGAVRLVRGGQ